MPPSLPVGALFDLLAVPPHLPGDPFDLRVVHGAATGGAAGGAAGGGGGPTPDVAAFTASLRAAASILVGSAPGVEGALNAAFSPARTFAAFEGALGGETGALALKAFGGAGAAVPLRVLLRAAGGGASDTVVVLQEAAAPGTPLLAALRAAVAAGAGYCREAAGVVLAEGADRLEACTHEALLHGVPLQGCAGLAAAPLGGVAESFRGPDGFLTVSLRRCAGYGRELL